MREWESHSKCFPLQFLVVFCCLRKVPDPENRENRHGKRKASQTKSLHHSYLWYHAYNAIVFTQPLPASHQHYHISDCLLNPLAYIGGQGLEINVECQMNYLWMYRRKSIHQWQKFTNSAEQVLCTDRNKILHEPSHQQNASWELAFTDSNEQSCGKV